MTLKVRKEKIVIIGGGIAGVSCSILLHREGFEVVICERDISIPVKGNAFLMHAEGFSVLHSMAKNFSEKNLPGKTIDTFILRRPDDSIIKYTKMEPWQCIKRKDVVEFLYDLIPNSILKCGRQFSHFIYEGEKAIAAVFKNGEIEYGDIFIGADGAQSEVRQQLFGPTNYTQVEVREVLGIAFNPELTKEKLFNFEKYLSGDKGLAFGFIPAAENELIWYMQYDVRLYKLEDETGSSLQKMCNKLLEDFPPIVKRLLDCSDFSKSYLWHARDFDILPGFHKNNVVLIGDAAHLALPFTSAGTTNALMDADILCKLLLTKEDYGIAFMNFYNERRDIVKEHLELGREIKNNFLNTEGMHVDEIKIPLISHKTVKKKTAPKYKKVHLLYFTDPVCSTCWTIQPQLRKLRVEYEDYLEVDYCMGGLLPSWENYNRGKIKTKQDAYDYWKSLAETYDMPVNPAIWKNDPLNSSYPPSIAFKAAQIQNTDEAVIFLRRLSELLFLKGVNITDPMVIQKEAYHSGLDVARLKRDLVTKAEKLFEEDIKLVKELSIEVLPTFIFSNRSDKSIILKGFQTYESFENVMQSFIPDLQKKTINYDFQKLFEKFQSLTTKEFAFLVDLDIISAIKNLELLNKKGLIEKQEIFGKETMWRILPSYKPFRGD